MISQTISLKPALLRIWTLVSIFSVFHQSAVLGDIAYTETLVPTTNSINNDEGLLGATLTVDFVSTDATYVNTFNFATVTAPSASLSISGSTVPQNNVTIVSAASAPTSASGVVALFVNSNGSSFITDRNNFANLVFPLPSGNLFRWPSPVYQAIASPAIGATVDPNHFFDGLPTGTPGMNITDSTGTLFSTYQYNVTRGIAVPEPSTSLIVWSLLGCVGITIGWRRWNKAA